MYLTALPRRASRPGAHMDGCFHPCVLPPGDERLAVTHPLYNILYREW